MKVASDRPPLELGILDARQRRQETCAGVDDAQPITEEPPEHRRHTLRFLGAQHTVVDEHARQLVAYRPIDDGGGHGGIDAAGEGADHAPVPDHGADALDLAPDEVLHRPGRLRLADTQHEIAQNLGALIGVVDLGVELDAEEPAASVAEGGERRVVARRQHLPAMGKRLHAIAVAHPDAQAFGPDPQSGEEIGVVADGDAGAAVLAALGARDRAAGQELKTPMP